MDDPTMTMDNDKHSRCVPIWDNSGELSNAEQEIDPTTTSPDGHKVEGDFTSATVDQLPQEPVLEVSKKRQKKYYHHFYFGEPKIPADILAMMPFQFVAMRFLEFCRKIDEANQPYLVGQAVMERTYLHLFLTKQEVEIAEYPMDKIRIAQIKHFNELKIQDMWGTNDRSNKINDYWHARKDEAKKYSINDFNPTSHAKDMKIALAREEVEATAETRVLNELKRNVPDVYYAHKAALRVKFKKRWGNGDQVGDKLTSEVLERDYA